MSQQPPWPPQPPPYGQQPYGQPQWSQPLQRPRSRRRFWLILSIIGGVLLFSCIACSVAVAVTSAPQGATQATTPTATLVSQLPQATFTSIPTTIPTLTPTQAPKALAEHLTFQGDISGMLTTGIDPHPITHDNPLPAYVQQPDGTFFDPAPPWTQCSDFDTSVGRDYVAVIVGNVGTSRYAVTIEINEDDPAYTKPGTELRPGNINSGGSVKVYEMGGKNRRWQQVYGPALQDTVIVLHTNRVSGTVDAWMATTDQSQKIAESTLHMQGDWHCG